LKIGAKFGRAVRAQRRALGFTQEQLAERSGLHKNFISRIERSSARKAENPTLEVVAAIAKALDCDPGELISHVGQGKNKAPLLAEYLEEIRAEDLQALVHLAKAMRKLARLERQGRR
jgi:transcriptional regulator with XRE-family HTH domain